MSKCTACGDKPENTAKDFTKAVVEINNPETLILLRKVVVPASMGDEEQVPPAIGKYNNVILYYEANKHVYLYSSDGIPTLIKTEIPQEIIDKIDTLENDVEDLNDAIDDVEQEIEDLKNSPDVVDIVATYAELQAYDTSKLGDNDIIRVLSDTTHDGESTYYRWDKTNSQWIYIGSVGSYYTKSETDTLLGNKQDTLTAGTGIIIDNNVISSSVQPGSIKVLTSDDFNYDFGETGSNNCVALWLLPEGIYSVGSGEDRVYAIPYIPESPSDESFYHEIEYQYCYSVVPYADNSMKLIMALNGIIDEDAKTSYMVNTNGSLAFKDHVMWQTQGLILSQELERRIAKTTTAPTSSTVGSVGQLLENTTNGDLYICTAIDSTDPQNKVYTWDTVGGPTVVQTTGTSTTDVMSQDATTNLVYKNNSKGSVRIGDGADVDATFANIAIGRNATATTWYGVAIGDQAHCPKNYSIAIGTGAGSQTNKGEYSISIGSYAHANHDHTVAIGGTVGGQNSVAIGFGSSATQKGQFDIGAVSATGAGYADSDYRLLTGLYDGQSAHDAATKGQLDSIAIKNTGAPTTSTVGIVGQLLEDTTNGGLYQCTAVDTTSTPAVYTWEEITLNGLQFKTLTAADVNFPVNNPSAVSLWRLPTGVYTSGSSSITMTMEDYTGGYYNSAYKLTPGKYAVVIHSSVNDSVDVYIHSHNEGVASGTVLSSTGSSSNKVIGPSKLAYDLNTTNEYAALAADQGKFLNQKIEERIMTGSGAPTTSTVGTVGKIYEDTTNGKLYICTTVSGSTYTWEEVGTGGGSTITMTTTDPGEGSALAENNYVGVYGGDPIIMDYSTNEVNTGAKWIDGKTIYKKTVDTGALTNATSKQIPHGITNLSKVIKIEGYTLNPTSSQNLPLCYSTSNALNNNIGVFVEGANIEMRIGADRTAFTESYVTLYYTKSS